LPIEVDPSKGGLEKVLRDYQILALRSIWENPGRGLSSREVFDSVNRALAHASTISRASIINFLNDMVDDGVLNYEEETCKGGSRRRYSAGLDEDGFKKHVARTVFESLLRDFPDETVDAVCESIRGDPSTSEKVNKCLG